MRDTFGGFHPLVNLIYFTLVIGLAMFLMHPVSLLLSLSCASAYAVYLHGQKAWRVGLKFLLPLLLLTALLNPLFNHAGATILAYLPNGNPLTLESTLFGLATAVMLVTVIAWFACFNTVITSEKIVYLFGRIVPVFALILAMALRLVPRFREQIKVITNAQKCLGQDFSQGNLFQKMRQGLKILSILATWALENAIETADSMKGRGYGLSGRTAFAIFRFNRRDAWAIGYITFCATIVLGGAVTGAYQFRYFPTIRGQWSGHQAILVFCAQLALAIFPIIVNLKEDLLWKRIESKS